MSPACISYLPLSPTHLIFYPSVSLPHSLPNSLLSIIAYKSDKSEDVRKTSIYKNDDIQLPPFLQKFTYYGYDMLHLPGNITHLSITCRFGFPSIFPSSLTHLTIENFDGLSFPSLPSSITHLTLIEICDPDISINLPPFLIYLKITECGLLSNISRLPSTLTHLIIDQEFINFSISPLPPSLQILELKCENIFTKKRRFPELPSSLKHLVCPQNEEYTPQTLPPNLSLLKYGFSSKPNYPIPNSIEILQLGSGKMPSSFPSNLKSLIISCSPSKIPRFPQSLTHLKSSYFLDPSIIPSSVTHLSFGRYTSPNLETVSFPKFITHLTINPPSKIKISHLPSSLIYLDFDSFGTDNLPSLPTSLKYLKTNAILPPLLPPLLTHLLISYGKIVPSLPQSLTHFYCDTGSDVCLPNLPPNLIYLYLPNKLPKKNKKNRYINDHFSPPPSSFPSSLRWLTCDAEWFDYWQLQDSVCEYCYVDQINK